MRAEPTWLDRGGQVMRLRGGVVEPVQDRNLWEEVPELLALRVFDDDSFLTVDSVGVVRVHPVGAPAMGVPLGAAAGAIDGTSGADFWYVGVSTSPHQLCHAVDGLVDSCVDVPAAGAQAYSPLLAVAPDGAAYVYDGGTTTYHFAGGTLTAIADITTAVAAFRGGGGATLVTTLDGRAFGLRGRDAHALEFVPELPGASLSPIVGTPDDYYVLSYDSESERTGCSFTDCSPHRVWWQQVIWHVLDGDAREVGYEECSESDRSGCDRETFGLGLDGDVVVVMGAPFRAASGG